MEKKNKSTINDEMNESENPFKSEKEEEALELVKKHMYGSAGAGLVPFPIIDMVAFMGIQINLVRRLSNLYEIEFKKHLVKPIISALIGSASPMLMVAPIASLVKIIPGIGHFIAAFITPALGGAATYAIGKVFIQHFESGGTILTLDPSKVKEYFAEKFKEGQKAV